MCFITEKNVQVNLKEVCPKFFMKFDRIVSKLMTNQRQVCGTIIIQTLNNNK